MMNLESAQEVIGKLSFASKMPCQTYSLPAKDCNIGSKLREVEGSVCNKCYAIRGNFARPSVQACMQKRLDSISHPLWVEAMVVAINETESSGFFRWHSSGDIQNLGHLIKICEVAKQLPHIKFWLPTREVGILNAFKSAGFNYPKNLIVRYSAAMIDEEPPKALLDHLGVLGSAVSKGDYTCKAPEQKNECLRCRKCWDTRYKVITYKYH